MRLNSGRITTDRSHEYNTGIVSVSISLQSKRTQKELQFPIYDLSAVDLVDEYTFNYFAEGTRGPTMSSDSPVTVTGQVCLSYGLSEAEYPAAGSGPQFPDSIGGKYGKISGVEWKEEYNQYQVHYYQPHYLFERWTDVEINWGELLAGIRYSYPPDQYFIMSIKAPTSLHSDIMNAYYGGGGIGFYSGRDLGNICFPGTIIIYLGAVPDPIEDLGALAVDNEEEAGEDPADSEVDRTKVDSTDAPAGFGSSGSFGGYSDSGSYSSGYNPVSVYYNNAVMKYDSIYMSEGEYSQFVEAGGGIVCEEGIYPNSSTVYIEKISLSISGSSMTVIQVAKFDDTPITNIGSKIYGYILKESGEKQPTFAGYVASISRRLGDSGQEIVYECRDLKFYLDQMCTPIKYKAPRYSIKTIADEVLRKAGIFQFSNNLPDVKISVDYTAESVRSVLDYLCTVAGSFNYWVDKNGILLLKDVATDSVIKEYRIPSEGEAVGTHQVISFDGLVDHSLSRSRIIAIGDYPYKKTTPLNSDQYGDSSYIASPWQETKSNGLQWDPRLVWYAYSTKMRAGWNHIYTTSQVLYVFYMATVNGEITGSPRMTPIIRRYGYEYPLLLESRGVWFQPSRNIVIFGPWRPRKVSGIWTLDPDYTKFIIDISYQPYTTDTSEAEETYKKIPIFYIYDTGNPGGTYVYKNTAFKKFDSQDQATDDTGLLEVVAKKLAQYFKTIYGGTLVLDGLETDLYLGGKLSLTNTSLPSNEASNLIIYEITYNLVNRTTTVSLSTRTYQGVPYIDHEIIKANQAWFESTILQDTTRRALENIVDTG